MKKFFPLVASLLLLASCSESNVINSSDSSISQTSEQTSVSISKNVLTFLEDGELYIDLNLTSIPEGFSIKINDKTLTATGKVTMTKDFTSQVNGTLEAPIYIYRIEDTGGVLGQGGGKVSDTANPVEMISAYLTRYAKRLYESRIYLCITDKEKGWDKTLAGVDASLSIF